jgi:hypothetical protein
MNPSEVSSGVAEAVTTRDALRECVVTHAVPGKPPVDRVYGFDKVFGPYSTQEDVYDDAVRPVVDEVLDGYNCTIFAYGQTGTGKTHTMEGDHQGCADSPETLPEDAGIIPRAMAHVFASLNASGAEYSVRCTFLELYNEEITDLLNPDAPAGPEPAPTAAMAPPSSGPGAGKHSSATGRHALMEDGKGGVAVRHLTEVCVSSPADIFAHLAAGSNRRRTAETLCNKQSSRSHSVFTVSVHARETNAEGEDVVKCGKLNLVDLAGSENVSKSGAKDSRAREAGEINKSLLTLGRVITALVDRSGHIPYRDSKLTRLLRDALGGKSKTCVVATVSPAASAVDETTSTLEYARRAASIKCRPEVNARVTKTGKIRELTAELDRLRADLRATREKNGVYMSQESYDADRIAAEAGAKKMAELESGIEIARRELETVSSLFETTKRANAALEREAAARRSEAEDAARRVDDVEASLAAKSNEADEAAHLLDAFEAAQERLRVKTGRLAEHLDTSKREVAALFGKIRRREDSREETVRDVEDARKAAEEKIEGLAAALAEVTRAEEAQREAWRSRVRSFVERRAEETARLREKLAEATATANQAGVRSATIAADAALAAADALEAAAKDARRAAERARKDALEAVAPVGEVVGQVVALVATAEETTNATLRSFEDEGRAEVQADADADADADSNSVRGALRRAEDEVASVFDATRRLAEAAIVAEDSPTGGTPARDASGTLLATPVRRGEVDDMVVARDVALAAYRAAKRDAERAQQEGAEGAEEEQGGADEEQGGADDEQGGVDDEQGGADDEQGGAETAAASSAASASPAHVSTTRRGGRSTRGKASAIPRAPLRSLTGDNAGEA